MGFSQYLAPTGLFAIAVLMDGQKITPERVATFGLIWLGVAIFALDAVRAGKSRTKNGCTNRSVGVCVSFPHPLPAGEGGSMSVSHRTG
ncbi:MAG: hypothetical protein AAF288_13660 [Planctomycetota bacterium]